MGAVALIATLAGCSSASPGVGRTTVTSTAAPTSVGGSSSASSAQSSTAGTSSAASPSAASSAAGAATVPVHVGGYPDGSTVGVGMPIIATFNKKITDGVDFAKHAVVTVNGKPANGAWYFEYTDPSSGHLMEAHYRTQNYWPAHADVHVAFSLKGVSAGTGLSFDGQLTTLDFKTGPANVATVDNTTHLMTVMSDGKLYGKFPVSLGANNTPTLRGTKVIMEKGRDISMRGPGYYDPHVKFTQRLTYSGEYLHAAPWNHHLGQYNSSNGCTNLSDAVAKQLYGFLRIGDVVQYPNANGPAMTMAQGYGDWNVLWTTWRAGGALTTT